MLVILIFRREITISYINLIISHNSHKRIRKKRNHILVNYNESWMDQNLCFLVLSGKLTSCWVFTFYKDKPVSKCSYFVFIWNLLFLLCLLCMPYEKCSLSAIVGKLYSMQHANRCSDNCIYCGVGEETEYL